MCDANSVLDRTGIYQHSRRDLILATRKIKHANEPVVHDNISRATAISCSAQYMC